ncbi:MAG: mandelate racemase/muconate lactonizing enzyme family protein [Opitutales bacterium]|jgi:L-alanine-DL-glutamate epimerase-like enolase superfamily enzyme|nr:mandelate racemase/muconate lactonizing enzyme family protein [Opitutales bacterium]MDG2169781.1 mandelate racemase/muconate lactonizing enzyme family protein [Opitutales bacterium]
MRRYSRRNVLRLLAASGGLAATHLALGRVYAATPVSATSQRITRFEIIPVRVHMHERVREVFAEVYRQQGINRDYYDSTLVKLYTDEGLVGVGDALLNVEDSLGSVPKAEAICKRLIGRSPWEFLLDDSLGGILMAVYDLIGQAAGLPVSRLFAPAPKTHIVQSWWSQCFPPDLMASEAKLGYDLGYRVHKVKARDFEDPVEQAEAVTSNVPEDLKIWADTNSTWVTPERAIKYGQRLTRFPQYFAIETPCERYTIEPFRQLKGRFPLKLAEHMPKDPMPFVREKLLDAFVVGGPIGKSFVQRALMAEVTGIPIWLQHSIFTGVAQVFQAHQAAAFPGVEHCVSITHVIQDDLMTEPFTMKDGLYKVPTKPGLGVTLDDEAIEKHRRG